MLKPCKKCKFYSEGNCHRFPPVAALLEEEDRDGCKYNSWYTAWPSVEGEDGCGEWKAIDGN